MRHVARGLIAASWLAAASLLNVPALAQAPGEASAVPPSDCDYSCLIGFARGYMAALAKKDPSAVRFSKHVRFTENNVEMPLGNDGLWATVTGIAPTGLEAADALTGEAAWIGTVQEHGLPVYYGMRLRVQEHEITEVETVVVRTTGLPLPFGDTTKLTHDPAFAEVLTPEQRRPRERLMAVADSYFSTVELNDGMVFAPFHDECARTENGMVTTKAAPGTSGTIAQGCEAQFKLGIYRINKRVRERRYLLVDEERGVVVATGFFDHANTFDTYQTTDGKERKTLLKWPNSISLVEAFKVVDGRIYRIEAVFSYVPYFMHSPFYPQPVVMPPPAPPAGSGAATCDRACLVGIADRYMEALVRQQPAGLPWAKNVRFTENSVSMRIGDGLWGSVGGKAPAALRVADPVSGNVAWFGVVYDHDAPAYLGLRLRVEDGKIAEVESLVARAKNPGPFGDPAKFQPDALFTQELPVAQRTERERMVALAEGYANTLQLNDGKVFVPFDPACARRENGVSVTQGEAAWPVVAKDVAMSVKGCEAQLKLGLYRPVDRVRDRRVPVVDEERGVAVAFGFADLGVRSTSYVTSDGKVRQVSDQYPSSRELFEIFRVRDGRIQKIEAVSVFQPYRMPSPWVR
ncbi:MAG: hypothetical protein ABI885_29280 [Gammaproteobacteria bacterium]